MTGRQAYIPTERVRRSLRDDVADALRRGSALSAAEIAERLGRRNSSVTDVIRAMHRVGEITPDDSTGARRWRLGSTR